MVHPLQLFTTDIVVGDDGLYISQISEEKIEGPMAAGNDNDMEERFQEMLGRVVSLEARILALEQKTWWSMLKEWLRSLYK